MIRGWSPPRVRRGAEHGGDVVAEHQSGNEDENQCRHDDQADAPFQAVGEQLRRRYTGRTGRRALISPNAVPAPVAMTIPLPRPVPTNVPLNAMFARSAAPVSAGTGAVYLVAANGSPVGGTHRAAGCWFRKGEDRREPLPAFQEHHITGYEAAAGVQCSVRPGAPGRTGWRAIGAPGRPSFVHVFS